VHVAITMSSNDYEIKKSVVKWDPETAFPNVDNCITGYQYSINGGIITTLTTGNYFFSINETLTDSKKCNNNHLLIQPIFLEDYIPPNVNLSGSTCNRGNKLCVVVLCVYSLYCLQLNMGVYIFSF